MSWRTQAACAGVPIEAFFPETPAARVRAEETARRWCSTCPVRALCRTQAAREIPGCRLAPKRRRTAVPCPSEAAYQRAVKRRRKPCMACRHAHAEYEKARWTAKRVAA